MVEKNLKEIVTRIEALLFTASKPVDVRELLSICGLRKKEKILSAVRELMKKYNNSESAVELVELPGERFYLRLRREYHELVKKYVKRPLFSRGIMRTLSFIAYHQPIEQSKVASVRGNSAYKHIKILIERGLVEAEEKGRTRILRTTQLLADYLGVPNNPSAIKKALISRMDENKKKDGELDSKEVLEVENVGKIEKQ
ncbi:MAG: SMC-Scp complex subunit ScpB [Thaumarchaeota archaeon]|nr:SMC-Scp complex subunit ScpB [Candidatus Geocrenenecus arthurdayi]MCL7391113.1 SMC-Scp complex subunit ScpB [Candidatus Geocrenenecus arthurdayi]MCL7396271.1 SMC-Scp complex subunit ScpB [Candidatus Geocrenenecus arthurdayi]